ncbi:hypothetical protein HMPREF0290_0160 [Corynebacterium efficiens YS-314]|nr:hypothetical protein HMPREF0290_0160 [Corynebacterium efficiens YS-314]
MTSSRTVSAGVLVDDRPLLPLPESAPQLEATCETRLVLFPKVMK